MIAGLLVRHLTRDLRRAREDARRDAEFAARKIVEDAAEWAKLPADAPLSKLIQHTHSLNEGVRRDCRARIAARPALGEEMIRLLGTGWAGHAVDCLRDAWPLPYAPLAAAFGSFLQRELETWRTTLERPGSAASWELNLRGRFEVAAKIVAEGGDLRGPLEAWDALLAGTQGLEGLVRSVRDLLGKTR
jgi:hypothetical protein